MSSIGPALLDCLRSVERSVDFCVGGVRQVFIPSVDVEGVGTLAFPIIAVQAEQLVSIAEAAPYGRGEATLVDRDVRRTWQIDAAKVRIAGRHWEKTLAEFVAEASRGLGVDEPVEAEFYKLLVYDAGSFFVAHRDTEKVPGMFGTMVLVLPSSHRGGELIVRHLDREVVLDPRPEEPSDVGFAAFFADCVHEVRPVTAGFRLTLVYNLRLPAKRRSLKAPDFREQQGRIVTLLRRWADAENEPDKLVLPLEHAYTPAELSFGALKGADGGIASILVKAAAEADCDLHLVLVSIEESGSAEGGSYYRRRSRDEEEDEAFEVVEVIDRGLILSEWRRPDGGEPGFRDFPFAEGELCPPDAFEDLTPDEQHFHEATGNEGASFERTYRRAGLVMWPRARRLTVLNQAGLGATLPHLEELTTRWETGDRALGSSSWRESDELSGHMLRAWPRKTWRGDDDTEPSRMLDLQVRLGNAQRIDEFLAGLSAEGYYAARDNEAIVRAARLLPARRAADLLVQIVKVNGPTHLGACADLLRRCATASVGTGDLIEMGAAVIDAMPGDPARSTVTEPWRRRETVTPRLVVDLLTAASRIDAGLAGRTIEHMLAWPKAYDPDEVLVPAAQALAKVAESAAWPAVLRLREAALDHLRKRIALPLQRPSDWARVNPLTCTCSDCRDLGVFLVASDRQDWRLKAIQHKRSHVEQSVRDSACDLDLATERRGTPHTLVAIKNQASYERRAEQRRRDLEQVEELAG